MCLLFFYIDINTALTRRGEEPIGSITFRYNVAQRRFIDRLVWDRLQNNSPIYNGDIIRTADMSEAEINFINSDDTIELFSNTLVQIFADSSGSRVDFSDGEISVNTVSGMVISSGENILNIEADSVFRASSLYDGEQGMDIMVSKGSVSVNGDTVSAGSGININEEGTVSSARQTAQAAAILPVSGARFLSREQEGINVDFIWNKLNYSPSALTRFEAAYDRNFTRILFREDTQEDNLSVALPPGTWFWRVYPAENPNMRGIPYSRVIVAHSPAPVLISPRENQEFVYTADLPLVRYQWTSSPQALSYNLEAADNPLMQSPVLNISVRASTGNQASVVSSQLKEGTWYWRVTPVYSREFAGDVRPSEANTVVIKHDPEMTVQDAMASFSQNQRSSSDHRQIFPPDSYVIADNLLHDMRFTWRTNLENVRFQFSDDQNFSKFLINERASLESFIIRSMPEGVYYWRVVGSENGQQRESPSRRLTIVGSLPPPDLHRVENVIARQEDVVIVSQENQVVNFNWQPTQEADYYSFKLYKGDSSSAPLMETIVYNTNTSVNMDAYSDGVYTWTVQALSRESMGSSRRTGVSAAQTVQVRHIKLANLEHPPTGHQYTGIDASRTPDTARWSSEETPINVVFVIARDARMTDIVHRIPNVPQEFTLPKLSSGDYYFSIRASTTDGFDLSSVPSHIRVLPIPLLPAPQNRTPANNHTIRPEHIVASRGVDFSWNRVQGANGYMLTIYQGTGRNRTTVIQTGVLTETSYTVEDIRMLGRGDFYWQVEALYVMEDGFIEQRGTLAENRLTVDIPSPSQVRIRDSGTLYGQ